MTPPMNPHQKLREDVVGLIERLRAQEDSGRRTMGGGSISHDGKSTMWGNEKIMRRRNPDGEEAALLIERLTLSQGGAALTQEAAKAHLRLWGAESTGERGDALVRMLIAFAAPTYEAGRRDMREAAGWQPIETCPAWKHDHMHTVLAVWSSRSVCETYWDEDEDFDTRPKWWISPREGWRSPGDMCIPVNQDAVTHWMPKPAPPALPTEPLGGEGNSDPE